MCRLPVSTIPVCRLSVRRLLVHRLPVRRLPVHRLPDRWEKRKGRRGEKVWRINRVKE